MSYVTSAIKTHINLLTHVDQNWNDSESRTAADSFLKGFFPGATITQYDRYFRFPKGSLVCIKQLTGTDFAVDCYSKKNVHCQNDFSMLLRRLSSLGNTVFDNVGFERMPPRIWDAFLDTFVPGGTFILLITIGGEILAPYLQRVYFYVPMVIVFITVGVFYYRRQNA